MNIKIPGTKAGAGYFLRTMMKANLPHDYRNHRKTPSFSYGDIRWCLRSRQSISSEVRGVTMKPLALAMGSIMLIPSCTDRRETDCEDRNYNSGY